MPSADSRSHSQTPKQGMDDVSGDSKGDDNSSPTGDVEAPSAKPGENVSSDAHDASTEAQAQAAVSNVSSDANDATTEAQAQAAVSSTNQATKTVPGSIEEISEDPDQSLPFPRHYEDLEEVEDESTAKKKAAQHYKAGTVILPRPNEEFTPDQPCQRPNRLQWAQYSQFWPTESTTTVYGEL